MRYETRNRYDFRKGDALYRHDASELGVEGSIHIGCVTALIQVIDQGVVNGRDLGRVLAFSADGIDFDIFASDEQLLTIANAILAAVKQKESV